MPLQTYTASPIKRRRRSKADMAVIRQAMLDIVLAGDGMTVRHLFYRLVAKGVVDKTEADYDGTVSRLAVELRRVKAIPFGKIIDGSRLYQAPTTHRNLQDALATTAANYRRSYWRTADRDVEVWCEKDAIRAIIQPVTWHRAVPLMVTRGFSSESTIQQLAEDTVRSGKPRVILSLNDYDPSGSIMLQDILDRARHYAPDARFHPQQVALTRKQVDEYRLPTRPTKVAGNNHAAKFGDDVSVELDALEPDDLCALLRDAIDAHVDAHELQTMEAAEESERGLLRLIAGEPQ